ncbi:hypothetical protein NDU88_001942 [Pleurodeles waltl]|uniref:Uncharacterized protein n=1 Tax=Pleurodeles waltl TaxID=8319 RepID=A0AAV7NC65_PLEWA|nr:hypothetical protein NDU88_001942 [Pleurodeles waltl]
MCGGSTRRRACRGARSLTRHEHCVCIGRPRMRRVVRRGQSHAERAPRQTTARLIAGVPISRHGDMPHKETPLISPLSNWCCPLAGYVTGLRHHSLLYHEPLKSLYICRRDMCLLQCTGATW